MRLKFLYILLFIFAAAMVVMLGMDWSERGRTSAGEVPDPPQPLPSHIVESELEDARSGDHPETHDIDFLIDHMSAARTRRAVMYLAAEGLYAIQALPTDEQPQWRLRLESAVQAALAEVDVIAAPPKPGGEAECIVNFNDHDILDSFPDDAQFMFLFDPWWIQLCSPNGRVHVEPTKYSHYHLSYEDQTVDLVTVEDPAAEPRYLSAHDGSEIIRIWVEHTFINNQPPIPFNMLSFTNIGPDVKFRYQKSNGQWFQWNSMAGGNTTWIISDFVVDVVEVQITRPGTSTSCGPDWEAAFPGDCPEEFKNFSLDNFMIGF